MPPEEPNTTQQGDQMIRFVQHGDYSKTDTFLQRMLRTVKLSRLDKYGRMGVRALEAATPVDTGETAKSWYYKTKRNDNGITIEWRNSNENNGELIAILLQYGHQTRNGGWVYGRDYINPALQPVFDKIAEDAWREVNS